METLEVKSTNKIRVSLEFDETEASTLIPEITDLVSRQPAMGDKCKALLKLYDTLSTAIRDHENGKQMWRVEIKTVLGSKRGEILVPNEILKSTVEAMAAISPNFVYDCYPARNE